MQGRGVSGCGVDARAGRKAAEKGLQAEPSGWGCWFDEGDASRQGRLCFPTNHVAGTAEPTGKNESGLTHHTAQETSRRPRVRVSRRSHAGATTKCGQIPL